jgi:hypothetical protein
VISLDQELARFHRTAGAAAAFQFGRELLQFILSELKTRKHRDGLASPALGLAPDTDDAIRRHRRFFALAGAGSDRLGALGADAPGVC